MRKKKKEQDKNKGKENSRARTRARVPSSKSEAGAKLKQEQERHTLGKTLRRSAANCSATHRLAVRVVVGDREEGWGIMFDNVMMSRS